MTLDDEIVNELSIQLNLKKNDLAVTLNEWKYDALTGIFVKGYERYVYLVFSRLSLAFNAKTARPIRSTTEC